MKKSKNVTRIKCKMISLCLSSVMIISSFISINVMADSSDQIINSLTDIPAVLEDWTDERATWSPYESSRNRTDYGRIFQR